MRVTAVVVNHNGGDQLAACLDALLAQDHPDLEVVVVDNASTDASEALLRAYERDGRVRVMRSPINLGYAGGANAGIAAASGEAVLVANYDVRPRPGYVGAAVAALAADPDRGAVQGKLLRTARSPHGDPVIDSTGHRAFVTRLFRNRGEGEVDRRQHDRAGEIFGVCGALALYRRAMLDDVAVAGEIFDEDLFLYFEDVDLDWRARLRGWRAWYTPDAVAEHERGGAGPRRTARVEQLNFRNRLLSIAKCDSPAALARHLPGFLLTTALKALELLVTHPVAFAGSLAGVRLLPAMLRKRRTVQQRAVVAPGEVAARWFEPFDYAGWVRTWWRRVRGVPLGA